jgi:polyphenol oxidase
VSYLFPYIGLLDQPICMNSFNLIAGTFAGILPHRLFDLGQDQAKQTFQANIQQCEISLGVPFVLMQQVHGHEVIHVDGLTRGGLVGDAMVTQKVGVGLWIKTADCLPVILYDAWNHKAAVIHAGWRGLEQEIIRLTIQQMNTKRAQLYAWIGPGISRSAYQVGPELRERWMRRDSRYKHCFYDCGHKYYFDLAQVASMQLKAEEVRCIERSSVCTYGDKRAFSHRAWLQGEKPYGRLASFIALN